jgi:hypothetical protein
MQIQSYTSQDIASKAPYPTQGPGKLPNHSFIKMQSLYSMYCLYGIVQRLDHFNEKL